MKIRHFLSILDLESEDVVRLINSSLEMAQNKQGHALPLEGRAVGLYFRRPSTRTRTAFFVGAQKLGAHVIQYAPNDLQIVTGESFADTVQVLSGFLNILVFRSNESILEMRQMAGQSEMAVINAMSNCEHPTQSIADLTTIKEAFGRIDDLHVLYIGEGNNTAAALAFAMSKLKNLQLTLVTPVGYGLAPDVLEKARSLGRKLGTTIHQTHDLTELPRGVDVVYTTRWQTMGAPKSDHNWRSKFKPYSVTSELMDKVSKPRGTIFLHDLPAVHGDDVVDEVLYGPQSRAFRQARHKMNSAMAILPWCLTAS